MKVLIVGLSGFVGTHLIHHLQNHGYETIGVDTSPQAQITADITEMESLSTRLQDH